MAINHILLRPQMLQRPVNPADQRIVEELMDMASRLLADGIKGGRAKDKFLEGVQEAFETLVADLQSRIGATSQKLMAWLAPIIQALEAFATSMGDINSPAEGIHFLARILLMVADLLAALSPAQIEAKLNALVAIITDDLGITRPRMEGFLANAVDIVAQKMKEEFLAGDHSEQAHNEFLIGCYLEKLKRFLHMQIDEMLIDFDLPKMVTQLVAFLKDIDWEQVRIAAQQMLTDAGNTVESLGILFDIFSGKFNVNVSVTVSTSAHRGSGPTPSPDCEDGLDPVSWYATYFQRKYVWDIPVGVVDRARLEDEPFFPTMSFKDSNLPPSTMEAIAHWSDVAASGLQILLHGRSLHKASHDRAGNITHMGLQTIKGLLTALLANNKDEDWVNTYKFIGSTPGDILTTLLTALATGFEGHHPFRGEQQWKFYFTLVGKDFVEAMLYKNWIARARQGLLSLLTLLNADPVGKPSSENHNRVEGFAMCIAEVASWLIAIAPGRSKFGIPYANERGKYVGYTFLAAGVSWVGAIGGWLLGWAITASKLPNGTDAVVSRPDAASFGWITLESIVAGFIKYPIYNYLIWNGRTNDGKLGKDAGNYSATPPIEPAFQTFKGYPTKVNSPYLMPFEAGQEQQCAQGNNGVWSHNSFTNQIYAFDWALDHRSEVLGVRNGLITTFSDAMPDHNDDLDNNITVEHSLTPPDPIHDRDWTNDPVVTSAHYIHGAHFSIRHLFAANGIPENQIVGTRVSQGEVVMLSGDTGISAYNHLHMHIGSPTARSLPWVFRDAPDNGVLTDLVWYGSENTRKPNVAGLSIGHPEEQKSLKLWVDVKVVSTGAKSVRLDFNTGHIHYGAILGSTNENIFRNCTLLWEQPNGTKQYLQILENKEDEATKHIDLKLSESWSPAPPNATVPPPAPPPPPPSVYQTVWILARALAATSNTIQLDGLARTQSDSYAGRFILVWWTASNGHVVYQYKEIASYDTGDKKVTIVGTWDTIPSKFAEYAIGGKPYTSSDTFYRRFSFITEETGHPTVTPVRRLHNTAISYRGLQEHVVAVPASNMLKLNAATTTVIAEVVGHFIAIYDGWPGFSKVVAYEEITAYTPGNQTITVAHNWQVPITPSFYYEIGAMKYPTATAEETTRIAFLCPDSGAGYTPTDFLDGVMGPPYQSQTYKTW